MFDDYGDFCALIEEGQQLADQIGESACLVIIDDCIDVMLVSSVIDQSQIIERIHPQWTINY